VYILQEIARCSNRGRKFTNTARHSNRGSRIRKFTNVPISPKLVSSGVLCPCVIFTFNFNIVKTELKIHKKVALHGPKGCGKSLLTAVMYLLFNQVVDSLYLTPHSNIFVDYFKGVC